MFDHPDPKCAACRHLINQCCEPAGEALRRLGYPAVTVRPALWASARLCPDFALSREAREEGEEEAGFGRLRRAAALAKGHFPP